MKLPQAELRTRRIEELKATKDSAPEALLGSYGRALLFAGHPYGRSVGGSERSLALAACRLNAKGVQIGRAHV